MSSASERSHVAKRPGTRSTRRTTARTPRKDPKGGLTSEGRAWFKRTTGSQLKPGVKKRQADMTPQEMKRKGSWALRFYGRTKLPKLKDDKGKPTRFALTAAAWGEPVPKTVAAARKIAAKGHRLLRAYAKQAAS
jgi:hypothetical protein